MASRVLLVARLDGAQVVPAGTSQASGTAAFLLDPTHRVLSFDLTYEGLMRGGAKAVTLRNFGKGANGAVVAVLCGEGAAPCPAGSGATISGKVDRLGERAKGRPLDNHFISELVSERVYVEIEATGGGPEIRGQLAPNDAMVPFVNYVARLGDARKTGAGAATGTAILSEVYLPGDKVQLFYAATIAGAAGAPASAGLVALPQNAAPAAAIKPAFRLPKFQVQVLRGRKSGSLSGLYEVKRGAAAPLVERILAGGAKSAGLVVTVGDRAATQLLGELEEVR